MSAAAIDYRYLYPFASGLYDTSTIPRLSLATFTDNDNSPYFYHGQFKSPRLTARLLQDLSTLVRTRFFLPIDPATLDPIVTSHGDFLRFEVFSGCCSVYARLDLPPDALRGETTGRGTTNVDFNAGMLGALGRVGRTDELAISIGADEVAMHLDGNKVIEKKVRLPIRWLKGLSSVAHYSEKLECRYELDRTVGARFLKSLPRGTDNRSRWHIVKSGNSVRLGLRAAKNSVAAGAVNRLRILENNIAEAKKLRIYGHPEIEASGWEVDFGASRFCMVMTHDVWRGFSGEGQGLDVLTSTPEKTLMSKLKSALRWQSVLDAKQLELGDCSAARIAAGLKYLGTSGLVGFDFRTGCHFHRQLPFDLDLVEKIQPRIKNAKKLFDSGAVRTVESTDSSQQNFEVNSSDAIHTVRLFSDSSKCTCPWYAKHGNNRGPCKHVLAVQLHLDAKISHC